MEVGGHTRQYPETTLGKEVSMPNPVLGEIIGPDILIVLLVLPQGLFGKARVVRV